MTRFQVNKIQAEQRRAAEEASMTESAEYVHALMIQIEQMPTLYEKLMHLTLLYQHLYDTPILLTNYERFRVAVWNKMNEQERALLSKLQALPARLAENNEYDMHIRGIISHVLDLMEWIRGKYW